MPMALWLDVPFSKTDLSEYITEENEYYYTVQNHWTAAEKYILGLEKGVSYISSTRVLLDLVSPIKSKEIKDIVEAIQAQDEISQKWIEDPSNEDGGYSSNFINQTNINSLIENIQYFESKSSSLTNDGINPKIEVLENLKIKYPYFMETDPVNNYDFVNRINEVKMLKDFLELAKNNLCDIIYE
jgi:tRNA(Ile)-lysidine synthase TilS/MesJ